MLEDELHSGLIVLDPSLGQLAALAKLCSLPVVQWFSHGIDVPVDVDSLVRIDLPGAGSESSGRAGPAVIPWR
ncbi:hypothetical protein AMJ71_02020 [candidate division TA06 bacterium SM1_40]|uniref:Uncharacterized protein n=2 Tax=Bacteria division TA06 TaxID=1156500 RepID=A0A0S8JLZ1_UNCT6|nr:MAG: hypothetical protein AMJ82_03465 [candidate division TA06 bacterium SM23_40]KPL10745.1 MAG: hypothetical protein AMJ71_02020 [candidate division TA06 bacterium SM1_40]